MTHQNLMKSFLDRCIRNHAEITIEMTQEVVAAFVARHRCDPAECDVFIQYDTETLTTKVRVERRKPDGSVVAQRGAEE